MIQSRSPSLAEVIQSAIEDRAQHLYTSLPGAIVDYDEGEQLATVQPLVKREYRDEQGARRVESLPIVHQVPIMFPGAGRWFFVSPLERGDTVLIVCTMASLDRWLQSGGEVDPGDVRRHSLSDAVAIPGLRDRRHAVSAPSGKMALGNADVQLVVDDTDLLLGDDGASARLVLDSALSQMITILETATDPSGACAAVAAALSAAFPTWPESYLTTKVKAK